MDKYVLRRDRAVAIGSPVSDGARPRFRVYTGSTAIRRGTATAQRDKAGKDRLIQLGVLAAHDADPTLYVFTRDHEFRSASNAGGVINDGNFSGPERWLNTETGATLKADLAARAHLNPIAQATRERADELWSDDELRAALVAYAQVLQWEAEDVDFSPTALHRELSQTVLVRRSEGAIARRMSNISAALDKVSRPYSRRYKPSFEHVGSGIRARMLAIWDELGGLAPTSDPQELASRTTRARKAITTKPPGQSSPTASTAQVTMYVRDPLVQAWVLNAANGICESCALPAPFTRADGQPYLEVHHVRHLAEGGPDTVENTVAICPNCHRRLHYGEDRMSFRASLFAKVPRLNQT